MLGVHTLRYCELCMPIFSFLVHWFLTESLDIHHRAVYFHGRFEVFTVMSMKNDVFCVFSAQLERILLGEKTQMYFFC